MRAPRAGGRARRRAPRRGARSRRSPRDSRAGADGSPSAESSELRSPAVNGSAGRNVAGVPAKTPAFVAAAIALAAHDGAVPAPAAGAASASASAPTTRVSLTSGESAPPGPALSGTGLAHALQRRDVRLTDSRRPWQQERFSTYDRTETNHAQTHCLSCRGGLSLRRRLRGRRHDTARDDDHHDHDHDAGRARTLVRRHRHRRRLEHADVGSPVGGPARRLAERPDGDGECRRRHPDQPGLTRARSRSPRSRSAILPPSGLRARHPRG